MTEEIIPTNGTSAEDVAYAKKVKEIYIDGVNVWSCKHYDLENNYCDQSYLGEGGLLKNTKNPKRCECSPNCYYKQLKRLEFELKVTKADYEASEQENKELKAELNKVIDEREKKIEETLLKGCYQSLGSECRIYELKESKYRTALEEIKSAIVEYLPKKQGDYNFSKSLNPVQYALLEYIQIQINEVLTP